jgi:hypothetical protein
MGTFYRQPDKSIWEASENRAEAKDETASHESKKVRPEKAGPADTGPIRAAVLKSWGLCFAEPPKTRRPFKRRAYKTTV